MALKFVSTMQVAAIAFLSWGLSACAQEAENAAEQGAVDTGAEQAQIDNQVENGAHQAEQGAATPEGTASEPLAVSLAGCAEDEPTIFACEFESGKKASFCVTQGVGEDEGISFAQFRIGDIDSEADMVWPEKPGDGAMRWHSVPYSGGGEAQIGFTDGDMQYIGYSSMVRTNFTEGEPNYPDIRDGFITLARGNESEHQSCIGHNDRPVDYELAELHAADAHDLLIIRENDEPAD